MEKSFSQNWHFLRLLTVSGFEELLVWWARRCCANVRRVPSSFPHWPHWNLFDAQSTGGWNWWAWRSNSAVDTNCLLQCGQIWWELSVWISSWVVVRVGTISSILTGPWSLGQSTFDWVYDGLQTVSQNYHQKRGRFSRLTQNVCNAPLLGY